LIERAEWGSGADRFESTLRSKPDWPQDDFDIADLVFSEWGIYIPVCYAEAEGKVARLVAHQNVSKKIARIDLINL